MLRDQEKSRLLDFIRNVLDDTWNHANDGPDEALEAIIEHPEMKRLLGHADD